MKKTILITLILFFTLTFSSYAQKTSTTTNETTPYEIGRNELKINMVSLIGFKWFDFSYERLLNEESSFGVGTLFALDNNTEYYRTFSLTPYYRQFFSPKYAEGFFVEAFTMIHSGKQDFYDDNGTFIAENQKYTDLAVGISSGYKVISRRGFAAEVYLGIGRNMLSKSDEEVVGRGGVSIGYRF